MGFPIGHKCHETEANEPNGTQDCACVSSDARRNAAHAAAACGIPSVAPPFDDDDCCECYCHAGDEDGLTEWDRQADQMEKAMSNRTKRLGRLGNAVVPQIAEWVGRRITELNEDFYG